MEYRRLRRLLQSLSRGTGSGRRLRGRPGPAARDRLREHSPRLSRRRSGRPPLLRRSAWAVRGSRRARKDAPIACSIAACGGPSSRSFRSRSARAPAAPTGPCPPDAPRCPRSPSAAPCLERDLGAVGAEGRASRHRGPRRSRARAPTRSSCQPAGVAAEQEAERHGLAGARRPWRRRWSPVASTAVDRRAAASGLGAGPGLLDADRAHQVGAGERAQLRGGELVAQAQDHEPVGRSAGPPPARVARARARSRKRS